MFVMLSTTHNPLKILSYTTLSKKKKKKPNHIYAKLRHDFCLGLGPIQTFSNTLKDLTKEAFNLINT